MNQPPMNQFKRFDVREMLPRGGEPFPEIQKRVANWLVKRCPNPQSEAPVKIELTTNQRVLATELGTVSETFSRTLA